MTIEIQFNSVTLQYEDIQEHFPELIPMINSSLPQKKKPKRRKRKKKKTVGMLIDEIQENISSG
ncbi:MAG: hypothetical protein ACYSO7_07390 [Planctomycetota bacterium]|jgi:hypothetical protein